ncbi:hypothetical protein EMIT043CA1_70262 [Pseudomonas brassicacearum]
MCRPHREQARSHRGSWVFMSSVFTAAHCGSEPAREGDVTVDEDVGCAGLFASKPAPTGFAVHMDFVSDEDPMWERACSRYSGQPGMDAGLAALGHEWPFAAAHGAMLERGTEWWGKALLAGPAPGSSKSDPP